MFKLQHIWLSYFVIWKIYIVSNNFRQQFKPTMFNRNLKKKHIFLVCAPVKIWDILHYWNCLVWATPWFGRFGPLTRFLFSTSQYSTGWLERLVKLKQNNQIKWTELYPLWTLYSSLLDIYAGFPLMRLIAGKIS